MINIDPNTHINGWYRDWLPRTSTHELKRLLTTPYGKDPAVRRRVEGELATRDQDRPAPTPDRPRQLPRRGRANAAASRVEHAAYLRKEMAKIKEEKQSPDKLANAIITAGKKRRGEISDQSDPPGLAGRILRAGRKARGEDR